jgi:hypothetical protein
MFPYLEFNYNDLGRGKLRVFDGNKEVFSIDSRSGYIDSAGRLQECIKQGVWWLKEKSVDTTEIAMFIPPETVGWKIRLFDSNKKFTHFLIHPDGNKPGSLGCIVFDSMAPELRILLDKLIDSDNEYPLFCNTAKGFENYGK